MVDQLFDVHLVYVLDGRRQKAIFVEERILITVGNILIFLRRHFASNGSENCIPSADVPLFDGR